VRRAPKLLNLAIAAVALALLVASGSSAATPELRLAAAGGALTLSNSKEGAAIFQAGAMQPGGEVSGSVVIANTGSVAGALSVSPTGGAIEAAGGGGGLLSNALQLVVLETTGAVDAVRYAGSPAAMPAVSLGQIAPGQQRVFQFVAKLPATAGNALQGARWSAGFTWTAQATTRAPAPVPDATPVPTPEPTPVPTPVGPQKPTPPAQTPTPGAGSPPPAAGATLGDQVFGMPASTRCANRYRFRIRVRRPKGVAFKKVTVTVNRRVKVRLAGTKARKLGSFVKLRRLPKGRVAIKVVAVTERGAKLTTKRTYRTCSVKKAKKPRRHRK
jgi:hypothetical protein